MSNKKIRIRWTLDLELALLDIWQEKLNDLRKQKRNSHVYNEIADRLKSSSGYINRDIDGNDIKIKISNFTQRYRIEKKAMASAGGSHWIHYERIHEIIGTLPCNDVLLTNENLDYSNASDQFNQKNDDAFCVEADYHEQESVSHDEITALENKTADLLSSPPTSPCSSSGVPVAARIAPKRKMKDDICRVLLHEIKRSNDISEKEALENAKLRERQLETFQAIGTTLNAILEYFQKESNK